MSPEVIVVGGGPAGAAAAYWTARAGHSVLLVEKSDYPREKTCGDGLTPRSIYELQGMGFDFSAQEFHKIIVTTGDDQPTDDGGMQSRPLGSF